MQSTSFKQRGPGVGLSDEESYPGMEARELEGRSHSERNRHPHDAEIGDGISQVKKSIAKRMQAKGGAYGARKAKNFIISGKFKKDQQFNPLLKVAETSQM